MNLVAWMIVACEIAFWILIALGLVSRYLLKLNKLGIFLLALTPIIDLLLLVMTGIDLYKGATATIAHGIAAIYIGISIVFGKSMISWADECFLYYVTKQGPKPRKRLGLEHAQHYFNGWLKSLLAYLIGTGLLITTIYAIDNSLRTEALAGIIKIWTMVIGIDLIISISHFIWPKKETNVEA